MIIIWEPDMGRRASLKSFEQSHVVFFFMFLASKAKQKEKQKLKLGTSTVFYYFLFSPNVFFFGCHLKLYRSEFYFPCFSTL